MPTTHNDKLIKKIFKEFDEILKTKIAIFYKTEFRDNFGNKINRRNEFEQLLKLSHSFLRQKLMEYRGEILKEILPKEFTKEQINDIGASWIGHPCCGYNQALRDIKKIVKEKFNIDL